MHELTEFGQEIFNDRYTMYPGESWEEACNRVATAVSMAESSDQVKVIKDQFYDVLINNEFMPAGRIWAAAGRPRANMLNCYVIPNGDSREEWGQAIKDTIIISGMGGGIGINCSDIRPAGDPIKGTGGVAGGPLAFMDVVNSLGEVIRASGGRRMALMLALSVNHPNILDFMKAKLQEKRLNNANVSVIIPENGPGHEFHEAIKNNSEYPLTWHDKVRSTINAREMWDMLVQNAIKSAEPGIMNLNLANEMSSLGYAKKLVCTNPCGEIGLEPYGACDLGAIVLPRFVKNNVFDWDKFKKVAGIAVRFLDNVLDVTTYPIPELEANVQQVRRLGVGITGLHDCLIAQGLEYDTEEGFEFTRKMMEVLRDECYKTSAILAEMKGSFPLFVHDKYMNRGFAKGLPSHIKNIIAEKGLRNCALLTIAPTGTISIVCGTSSGIEPIFSLGFQRIVRKDDGDHKRLIVHPMVEAMMKQGYDINKIKTTYQISVRSHLEMQKICQEYVDNAISKTINLPNSVLSDAKAQDDISKLLFEYYPYLKGITVYTDGSRSAAPIQSVSVQDIINLNCPSGQCTI